MDVRRYYPELFVHVHIKIIEASDHILGSFDSSLSGYVERLFRKRNVELLKNTLVSEVTADHVILRDGSKLPFGLVVWSTGVKQIPLIDRLVNVKKSKNGRLIVNEFLRLKDLDGNVIDSVYGMGDCAAYKEKPLPQLAQVASQQGIYIAKLFNGSIDSPFKYQHLVRPLHFTSLILTFYAQPLLTYLSCIGRDGIHWRVARSVGRNECRRRTEGFSSSSKRSSGIPPMESRILDETSLLHQQVPHPLVLA